MNLLLFCVCVCGHPVCRSFARRVCSLVFVLVFCLFCVLCVVHSLLEPPPFEMVEAGVKHYINALAAFFVRQGGLFIFPAQSCRFHVVSCWRSRKAHACSPFVVCVCVLCVCVCV